MAKFKAIVTEDVPGNRLLSLKTETRSGEDVMTISVTQSGESPDFRSTGELKADQEVSVTIKNEPVWEVEASEDLTAGSYVQVGEDGTVISGEGFGYVVESVENGGTAKVVRQASGTAEQGPQGPKGDTGAQDEPGAKGAKGDKGEPGNDAEPQFTEEEVTALKSLIEDGE